jgi:hypothetical protein
MSAQNSRHSRVSKVLPALLTLFAAGGALAQPGGPAEAHQPGDFVNLSSCANGICHGAGAPLGDFAGEPPKILGNEYTSRVLDPHFRATAVLRNALSAEIAAAVAPGKKAWQLQQCLDCHGSNTQAVRSGILDVEDGISCQSCHGPAGGWWKSHYEEGWTHEKSVAAGMTDLRSPAGRARVCLGCHLGDERRQVDHRLLAAGHPQLVFELDNYSEVAELRHWLPDAVRTSRDGRRPSHGMPAWAAGQVSAFRESLELVAARSGRKEGPWPDYADLACSSCHHEIGDSSWRKQPGYRFRGGLPPWSPAKWLVLRELLRVAAPEELAKVEPKVDALADQLGAAGDRVYIAGMARELEKELGALAGKVGQVRWNEKKLHELLKGLAGRSAELAIDPAAARQAAFTAHSLATELLILDRRAARSGLLPKVDKLFNLLEAKGSFDRAQFAQTLASLE